MTVARASQVVAEVIRANTGVTVRASQVLVEVLRARPGIIVAASQVVIEALRPNVDEVAPAGTARPVVFVVT